MSRPYVGIGPSAASYLDGVRCKNVDDTSIYIDDVESGRSPARDHEELSGHALAGETAMLQLRLNRGIDVQQFTRRVGLDPVELYGDSLNEFTADGLLAVDSDHIRLTDQGRLVADRIIRELLYSTP